MKVSQFKRFLQDDYSGADQWFYDFLGNLNMMIDTLNPLLQGNVDIDNNQLAERVIISLSHNTPISIRLRKLTVQPNIVRLGYAGGNPGVAYISGYNKDGTVNAGVYFLGTPPTAAVSCILIFEP